MEPVENNAPKNNESIGTPVPPSAPTAPNPTAPTSDSRALMGILSYLGILVLIPYIVEKKDPFVRFHTGQGLTLLIIGVIVYVIAYLPLTFILFPVMMLLKLGIFILSIIGIVHVVQEKEVPLPLVGGLAKKLNL